MEEQIKQDCAVDLLVYSIVEQAIVDLRWGYIYFRDHSEQLPALEKQQTRLRAKRLALSNQIKKARETTPLNEAHRQHLEWLVNDLSPRLRKTDRECCKVTDKITKIHLAKQYIDECEHFFIGAWYAQLMDIDGEHLILQVRQRAKYDKMRHRPKKRINKKEQ